MSLSRRLSGRDEAHGDVLEILTLATNVDPLVQESKRLSCKPMRVWVLRDVLPQAHVAE